MKILSVLLAVALIIVGCDKSQVAKQESGPMPVTNAVKTGDWMLTYSENNASVDVGLTFFKFDTNGSLVAIKNGAAFNGTWTEANTNGNNTLKLNITTTDAKLQKTNRTWKVTGVSEYFIDLKDTDAASSATVQLMKH